MKCPKTLPYRQLQSFLKMLRAKGYAVGCKLSCGKEKLYVEFVRISTQVREEAEAKQAAEQAARVEECRQAAEAARKAAEARKPKLSLFDTLKTKAESRGYCSTEAINIAQYMINNAHSPNQKVQKIFWSMVDRLQVTVRI